MEEFRDPALADRYILEGLWLSRVSPPSEETVSSALRWCAEIVAQDEPLPPPGMVCDLGLLALQPVAEHQETDRSADVLTAALLRQYEDYVLGKIYMDSSFERGADALAKLPDAQRAGGLAYLIQRFRERAEIDGALLGMSVVKRLQDADPLELLQRGWDLLHDDAEDSAAAWEARYRRCVAGVRQAGELLGAEDIFELEHGAALAAFGERLALRQVLQACDWFENRLPLQKPRSLGTHQQTATQITDEDFYPIGGYTSISTRGTIESLLHSQLAYMEKDERPDLFDIKFLRDELYYYSRDENQFFRRRRTFVFALYPDLEKARFKDPGLPWQRSILALGGMLAMVRRLTEWLGDEALLFEFVLLGGPSELKNEFELLQMLLHEQRRNGTADVLRMSDRELPEHCQERARRSLCSCLAVSSKDRQPEVEPAGLIRWNLEASPGWGWEPGMALERFEQPTLLETWREGLEKLAGHWV